MTCDDPPERQYAMSAGGFVALESRLSTLELIDIPAVREQRFEAVPRSTPFAFALRGIEQRCRFNRGRIDLASLDCYRRFRPRIGSERR